MAMSKKMRDANQDEPASKIIMYRHNGDFSCVTEQFIQWKEPAPNHATEPIIIKKTLGE